MAETSVQIAEEKKNLPSINEELATIFPESAEKFLKKKRGRPLKDPSKLSVKKASGRGPGRPRIHPLKEKVPGRGRGRPKKNLTSAVTQQKVPGRGRGRPKKNLTSAVTQQKKPGRVGRPKKIQETEVIETKNFDPKRKLAEQLDADSGRLRKRARLSYVDDFVDLLEEESDAGSDSAVHLESASETDSGFLSDTTHKRRGRPKKNMDKKLQTSVKRGRGRPSKQLQAHGLKTGRGRPRKNNVLTKTLVVSLERLPVLDNRTGQLPSRMIETPSLGGKRGRPKGSGLSNMREVSVSLERLNDDYIKKESSLSSPKKSSAASPKKRGRPPKQVTQDKIPVKKLKESPCQVEPQSSPEKKKRGRPKGASSPKAVPPSGKKRGRPKKSDTAELISKVEKTPTGRGRGRPKVEKTPSARGRGRPKKLAAQAADQSYDSKDTGTFDKHSQLETGQHLNDINDINSDLASEADGKGILKVKSATGEDLQFVIEVNRSHSNSPTNVATDSDKTEEDKKEKNEVTDSILNGGGDCVVEDSDIDRQIEMDNSCIGKIDSSNEIPQQTGLTECENLIGCCEKEKETGFSESYFKITEKSADIEKSREKCATAEKINIFAQNELLSKDSSDLLVNGKESPRSSQLRTDEIGEK